jgi:predicted AlkP superfamily pyrophosphatase or phosphodiesterase
MVRVLLLMLLIILPRGIQSADRPQLIVIISIDQMRANHLTRYASLYEQGFKRLTTEGVFYKNADVNYSGTSTGPGHATLGTGMYPWKSGIVANNYTERATGKKVYCVSDSTAESVEGDGGKMSARNLLVPGFGDWLRATSPTSKVISLSYKDRAAILMGGKRPNAAFWYDRKSGRMATSSYYMSALPAWTKEFNASGWIAKNLPTEWTKLLPENVYERFGPDDMPGEPLRQGTRTFPHAITPGKEIGQLFGTPWGNDYLLDFATAAIQGERLGKRGTVDLLCVSLSTTDNVGSEFGPNSHEMIDNLVRIDRSLGKFLANLETMFGRGGVVVAFSGDHGVMQTPEYLNQFEHIAARRINNAVQVDAVVKQMDSTLRREQGIKQRILKSGMINEEALKAAGANIASVEQRLRQALLRVDGVADVVFKRELTDPASPDRPYLDVYRHSFLEERSPDYFVRDCEYCLDGEGTTGTAHGSPYLYDRLVPLVFWGMGQTPSKIDRTVHTVDLVATIAKLYGIPAPANIDGVPLKEVVE